VAVIWAATTAEAPAEGAAQDREGLVRISSTRRVWALMFSYALRAISPGPGPHDFVAYSQRAAQSSRRTKPNRWRDPADSPGHRYFFWGGRPTAAWTTARPSACYAGDARVDHHWASTTATTSVAIRHGRDSFSTFIGAGSQMVGVKVRLVRFYERAGRDADRHRVGLWSLVKFGLLSAMRPGTGGQRGPLGRDRGSSCLRRRIALCSFFFFFFWFVLTLERETSTATA